MKHIHLFCIALSICSVIPANATIGARTPITSLVNSASAIIVGPVEATMFVAAAPITMQFAITASRVIKGSIPPGTIVTTKHVLPPGLRPSGQTAPVKLHDYGIFFLSGRQGGSWDLLPVYDGSPIWQEAFLRIPPQASPGVRETAIAALPASPSPLDMVLTEVIIARESGMVSSVADLADEFRHTRSAVLAAAFARFQTKSDPKLRFLGLRGSLAVGDASALLSVRSNQLALASDPGWPRFLDEIQSYYPNTSPQGLSILGQIAADSSIRHDLRSAAAGALARMHTRESLPMLAALLDDPNPALRAIACGGIAAFANNLAIGSHQPGPSHLSPYQTHETITHATFSASHTPFWKAWWQKHRAKLTQ